MGEWSPSHLIVAGLALATIIGQAVWVLARLKTTTERLEKQLDKQGETFFHALERLEERIDKRFVEMNQRLSDMQAETNQRLSDMQAETNQRLSSMQAETNHRFAEINQRLSDMDANIRQLNQNHIEHLNRHH